MAVQIVFEKHSTSEDNENGLASGWLPGRLSPLGRTQAQWLGERRRNAGVAAVFSSDLRRAAETAAIAFGGSGIPLLLDWRLRECDYGERNGMPAAELRAHRRDFLDQPYPGGESWRQAIERVGRCLADLPVRWSGQRVLVIGHSATHWGLEHLLGGVGLEDLLEAGSVWQEGWEYVLG
ncbi:MAG TPA: histidine phosphatase family protein [Streptosporangiaceae bacterium]|nr:histidine phosphatase family protein [Streptosporangiaceae bacterium]